MAKRRGNGEGCIRQLKSGYWEARITIGKKPDGKPNVKTFTGKSQKIVQQRLNNFKQSINENRNLTNGNINLTQWLDTWFESYVVNNLKLSTIVSYELIIRRHLNPTLGHIKLQHLKKIDIETLYAKIVKQKLSAKSIKNIHAVLHKALDEAYKNEYIIKNPADIVTIPKSREPKKEILVYSKEEQKLLVDNCPNNTYGVAIKLALYSGLRLGELLGITWDDVDFENKIISINKQVNRLKDFNPDATTKTKLSIQYYVKTRTSQRTVSILDNTIHLLKEHKKQQNQEKLLLGNSYNNLGMVFARYDGNLIDPATQRNKYYEVQEKLKLEKRNFHALRHTFATRAVESGVHIKTISEMLGHANIQITMDTYSHVSIQLQEDALKRMEAHMQS